MKKLLFLTLSVLLTGYVFGQDSPVIPKKKQPSNSTSKNVNEQGAPAKQIENIEVESMKYYNTGLDKHFANDYSGALADFDKAIEINDKNIDAYSARGLAKGKLNDLNGAIVDYNKVIELDSNNAAAYCARGMMKIVLKQKEGGCLDLTRAIELGDKRAPDLKTEYCTQ
jgi:Flp pilus assembly protein TadD